MQVLTLDSPAEQLERVVRVEVWADLICLIRCGQYAEPEQEPARNYCTNVIDVRLLDALDLLHALDDEAGRTVAHYERIFIPTYTGIDCQCPSCRGSFTHWIFLLHSGDAYHGALRTEVYFRMFSESLQDYHEPRPWL